MHAPYSRGASSKREHAARRLACTLQETETVRLRCDLTVSQLRARVPWPSDTELLVRRRLRFYKRESPAARMGCAVGAMPRVLLAAMRRCRQTRRRRALRGQHKRARWSGELSSACGEKSRDVRSDSQTAEKTGGAAVAYKLRRTLPAPVDPRQTRSSSPAILGTLSFPPFNNKR